VTRRSPAIAISCAFLIGLSENPLWADWKDEIGFTRLQALAGASLPTAPSSGLTQVEASTTEAPVYTFLPDSSNPALSGKTIINKSFALGSGISGHATHVATNFYGNGSLLPGSVTVDAYLADDWLDTGFLNFGNSIAPLTETRAVQNHSWVGLADTPDADALEMNQRLDYAIDRDGFVCVVGENNGSTNPLPDLLGQSYHTISVGRDDGNHSAGFTTLDGAGRIKPEIVAPSASPESATSWTTPMVAGAAGMLHAKLSAAPISLPVEDRPRVVKALLLASATKNTVPGWDNTTTRPLDDRYGSGELNIHHAWLAMSAGRATASNSTSYGIRGWAAESASLSSTKTYFFTIPAGPVPTPFCATLTWHRVIEDGLPALIAWGNLTTSMADLNLRLHQASGFTVGSQISESASTVDNVEMIYQPALAPGNYALVVQTASTISTPFALAWHSLPAVTVAATQPTAREIDGQVATVTITRTGDTTLPMQVPLTIGGTAISGTHYLALPSTVTIPAGQSSLALQVTPVSDSFAQGTRTVTVAVSADFALVRDAGQTALLTIEDKPFDAWRFANFTGPELANLAISGETADPDGDQLSNLIEYGLGLPPKSPGVSTVILIQPADHLTLSAAKNLNATDINWSAEVSANLTSWNPAVIITNNASNFTARDSILITDAERRFIRLKITRP
jgi:hypothetical protein